MKRKKTKSGPAIAQSDFLKELGKQFFNARGTPTWPPAPSADVRKAQAATQMPTALRAMIRAAALDKPLPAAAAATALGRVRAAAAITKWPTDKSKVAKIWKRSIAKYRMFEVAWAIDIMAEALVRSGGGGGPRDWPPGGHG